MPVPCHNPRAARFTLMGALLLSACEQPAIPPPEAAQELVVLVRAGPATYFEGADGTPAGYDVDLLRLFSAEKGLPLHFIEAGDPSQLLSDVADGGVHIGAGGLYRPPSLATGRVGAIANKVMARVTAKTAADPVETVLWSSGYYTVEATLIYNGEGYKPGNWNELDGETVAYVDGSGLAPDIDELRRAHPRIGWMAIGVPSVEALISQVSDGSISYAVVASNEAAAVRNAYLGYETGFSGGGRRELAWAVAPQFPALRAELDAFLARAKRDGTLQKLAQRYFVRNRQLPRIDAGVFHERVRSLLPQYRHFLQEAQEATGIEWRLLAAVAYQESQWDPAATSETGVRGLMQLTEDTARHLGVVDRLDPKASINAAARYLRDLKEKLPRRIAEPDRTWFALAAFNIGLGHLEDARVLAQKQKLNPDLWNDVKKVLPLLAEPEYHVNAKNGYARGGMPVAFVDRVRGYYDILLAVQQATPPRLRMLPREPPSPEPPVVSVN